jgi:TetR/AcrR family transcriptional regulator
MTTSKPTMRTGAREGNERAILAAAESVFALHGFSGATMSAIAQAAGLPKPNVHYYFSTKAELYRAVIGRVLEAWLSAADAFDTSDDPTEALASYIGAKMDLARTMPLASKIWASEILRNAPIIQDFLETTLRDWVKSRESVLNKWISSGHIKPIEPRFLFYMIWATTQQYANAAHEISTLEGGELDDSAFARAKRQVIDVIVSGVVTARR